MPRYKNKPFLLMIITSVSFHAAEERYLNSNIGCKLLFTGVYYLNKSKLA
jgi:hypothetical protein